MILENSKLKVQFDDSDGAIISLFNKELNRDAITSPQSAENFRLSIPLETDWTHIVIGKGLAAECSLTAPDKGQLFWKEIPVQGKAESITVRADVWLDQDELRSTVTVENVSPYKIDYIWYPILGGVTKLSDREPDNLFQAFFCGTVQENIYESDWVDENNRYWYTAREFKSAVYPKTSSMQFINLFNSKSGLYVSSEDNKDFYTGFYLEHQRASTPMTLSIVKAPFMKPGEKHTTCVNVLSFYKGSWHIAGDKYRHWLSSWMTRADRAPWVKDLDGWLAFQGHSGDMHIAHPYEEYPQWYEKAKAVGLNAVHIHCGVHDEGIEGGYPYWNNYSKRMGGKEKLLEVIKEIQDQGGRVITFTKDNKVNQGLPEYGEKFWKYAIRLRDGANPRIAYNVGTLDMLCSGAQLAVMCRGNSEWQDFIVEQMEEIAKVGFDGNMIDEWCSGLDLCMAEDHGHSKPTGQLSGQHELGKRIRAVSKAANPEYLLAGEELCDAAYEYMDLSFSRGGCAAWWGRDPRYYEVFRYCIPNLQITAEILENEYSHLNYALACGYMMVLCIDYYHSGPEAYPEFAAYFSEIIRIRKAIRSYFVYGEFRDALDYMNEADGGGRLKSYRLKGKEMLVLYSGGEAFDYAVDLKRCVNNILKRSPFSPDESMTAASRLTGSVPKNSIVVFELDREN